MDLWQWIAIVGGVLLFLFALMVLVTVVAVKLRGSRRSSGVVAPNPYLGGSLRKRMETEDKEEAERVAEALYATARHLKAQEERNAGMKGLATSIQGLLGGTPPN